MVTVKEELIRIEAREDLHKMIFSSIAVLEDHTIEWLIEQYPWLFVSYTDTNEPLLLHCSLLPDGRCAINQSLVDLFNRQKPQSFSDFLFLATFYDPIGMRTQYRKRDPFLSPEFSDCTWGQVRFWLLCTISIHGVKSAFGSYVPYQ